MSPQRTSERIREDLKDQLANWGYASSDGPNLPTKLALIGMATAALTVMTAGYSAYNSYDNAQQDNAVVTAGTQAFPGSQAIDPQLLGLSQDGNREQLMAQPNTTGGLDIVAVASAASGPQDSNYINVSFTGIDTANVCPVNAEEWQAALAHVHRDGTATVTCSSTGVWTITGRDATEISTTNARTVSISSGATSRAGLGIGD